MCGFCGIVGAERQATLETVEAMARTLSHRGPDDFGVWRKGFRGPAGERAVALGHTRLSVLDLSSLGHQPMSSEDGEVTIAYNGEVYNFRALREELIALGHRFRSECDTEVLIEAYRAWGFGAFERLVGMFAFAVWDAPRQRLVMVRDRLGIKPLYYRHDGDLLTFGSELRALRRHPKFEARIDRGALGLYLQHGYVTGPQTIYTDVRRVMPGAYVVWEAGRVFAESYWRLTDREDAPPPRSFDDAVTTLEGLLGDAVEQRLIADVPLGAFLSGGIDSSAIVSLMVERAPGGVRTFSIGFREAGYDEAPHAQRVASHLGCDHTELYVDREQAVQVAQELPSLYDEPFGDSSAIPTVLLSRLTRRHVTVALSGDGGDELFGGYDQYGKLGRLLPWMRAPHPLRRLVAAAAPLVPVRSLSRGLQHLGGETPRDLAEGVMRFFDPADLRAACGEEAGEPCLTYRQAFDGAPTLDPVRRSMVADAATFLPDDILVKVDRASMSVGLEARVPILDHRVARFALSLPLDVLWHGGVTKAPLREIAYRRIPSSLLDRPKQGFAIPVDSLLQNELTDWTARYLAPARLAEEGILDPEGVQRLRRAARRSGAEGSLRFLWFVLCFQRWYAHCHRGEDVC